MLCASRLGQSPFRLPPFHHVSLAAVFLDQLAYAVATFAGALGAFDAKHVELALDVAKHQMSPPMHVTIGLSRSGQYGEQPALKILVHLVDGLVHRPRKMLVELCTGDGKRFWYRTFAVEKYEVAECFPGVIPTLLGIVLQQDLYAKRVFKHRTSFAGVV
jgi:hypothetical protein